MKNISSLTYKRLLFIVTAILTVSLAHYFTDTKYWYYHNIYQKLYYIAIFAASFWFGMKGGILTALAVSILYLGHIMLQWHGPELYNLSRFLELGLYNVIGFVTGYLSNREAQERKKYRNAAEQLDLLYSRLRDQAQLLLVAEEAMRRADRMKAVGELSASLAHEIRNPLGGIRGAVQIIGDRIKKTDREYEFLQIVNKEIDRLNRVTGRYLSYTKPEKTESAEADINMAVKKVFSLIEQRLKKMKITFQENLFPGLPAAAINSDQIEQVLLNLFMNAVQVMPDGGVLRAETALTDGQILCSVSDTGSGIPEEHINNIFKPFFTTRENGAGLGLFIAHRIAGACGGRITAGPASGGGAVFRIYIPAKNTK